LPDPKPRLVITYCRQCNWLLRAGWLAQELLTTFAEELGEVALVPGTGGVLEIRCDGDIVWERRRDGGFPDLAVLKTRLRDRIAPQRELGHTDRSAAARREAGGP
jgi:selenoprotein W-related protein